MSEVGRGRAPDGNLSPEGDLPAAWSPEELTRQAIERLPPRTRRPATRLVAGWPGRIALKSAESCVRIEIFDRSMTIAARTLLIAAAGLAAISTAPAQTDSSSDAQAAVTVVRAAS